MTPREQHRGKDEEHTLSSLVALMLWILRRAEPRRHLLSEGEAADGPDSLALLWIMSGFTCGGRWNI